MTDNYCNCGDVARNVYSKGKEDPTMCGLCNKEIKQEVAPLDFNFKCGCFIRAYLDMNNRLNAGLSCCKDHEHAYAKASDFYLSLNAELTIKKVVLQELLKKIEALKTHPEMSDALAQDKLMHEYRHDNALTEVIKVIEEVLICQP